jgi:hypothetical protein
MVNTQSEKPGSSNTAPANLYWATMWAQNIWEEFHQLNQDHDNLINAIAKRKVWKENYTYDKKFRQQSNPKETLTKQPKDLKFALNILNNYIELSLKDWALKNSVNPALLTREFALGKK